MRSRNAESKEFKKKCIEAESQKERCEAGRQASLDGSG